MKPRSSGRRWIWALALVVAGAGACKKKAEHAPHAPQRLALAAPDAARAAQVVAVTMADAEGTLRRVGQVTKKLGLPFGDADLRRWLTARARAPEAVVSRLDLGKPIGLAAVATPHAQAGDAGVKAEVKVAVAGALKDASAAGAAAFVAAIGRVVEQRQDAVRVSSGDAAAAGPVWLLVRDGAVIAADSVDGLVAAGALALEARTSKRTEDVGLRLFPEGLARAEGTTLEAALAKGKDAFAKSQAESRARPGLTDPKLQALGNDLLQKMIDFIFEAIAGTTHVDFALSLDEAKGFTWRTAVAARPGTPFTRWTPRPYGVPPGFLSETPPAAFMAMSDLPLRAQVVPAVAGALEAILTPAERAKAEAAMTLFMNALAGPWAMSNDVTDAPGLPFTYDVSYDLKPGTDAKALLASMEETMKSKWLPKLVDVAMAGLGKVKLGVKRDGDALVSTVALDTKSLPKDTRAAFAAMPLFDGKPVVARTSVVGDRLVITTGADGKARFARMQAAATAPAPPAGVLANALAETKGADGLFYVDFATLVRTGIKLAAQNPLLAAGGKGGANPAAMMGMAEAMLGNASLVFYGALKGGKDGISYEARAPMATLESIAQIARGALGAFGGAGAPAQ